MAQITPQMLISRPWTLKSLPGRSNHSPDRQITSLACSFRWLRSLPRCSDRSLDAKISAWTLKSFPRPSDYKSCLFISRAQITTQMLRSLPGRSDQSLDAQITPRTLRLQVLLCLLCLLVHCDGSDHYPDAQIAPWTLKSLPGRSNHSPDRQIASLACLLVHFDGSDHYPDAQIAPWTLKSVRRPSDYKSCYACLFIAMAQITPWTLKSVLTSLACSFRWLRSLPRCSDRSLDAKISAWTLKSFPRPSDYKSCLFISIAQITTQMLRSHPGRSNHSLDAKITPQTLRLQVSLCLLCLLVHCDGSDHYPDAQIAPWTLKSLPGHSNHPPDPQITSLAMLAMLACSFRSLRSLPR